jgi:hypothetical protein
MIRKTFSARRGLCCAAFMVVLGSSVSLGQTTPVAPASQAAIEFPVVMRQNVAAGKTPVGTKVEAKLQAATLLNGTVIPKDAVLSGEVIESVAKSASDPSRLAIRMDSVQWKNGSAPIKVYLTAWYYPTATIAPPDLSYGPTDAQHTPRNWNGEGPYYDPKSPAYQPLPGNPKDKDQSAMPGASNHRVLMKNVDSLRANDGGIVITSNRADIKIDKTTIYVLTAGELLPTNK